jgi:hypothetical protein
MQDAEVSDLIKLLRKDKNPNYLDLLSALCVCDDASMAQHQDRITRMLLQESKGVVYLTEFHATDDEVIVSVSGRRDDWQSLPR